MNLVAFSVRTKGLTNFMRRLRTVFTRFGFSEARTRRNLRSIVDTVRPYGTGPTLFIPALVLHRHAGLIAEIAYHGAEIGIHGYVHNDYRELSAEQQYMQTELATAVFREDRIAYAGFRNPYLGWTEASVEVFAQLAFTYDSNEAALHDVVELGTFPEVLRASYAKSLKLFQAIPCTAYTVRPHREGALIRIPTSIPDDEMLYDRLHVTDNQALGEIWTRVMRCVYDLGGIYVLNLHPERGVLCRPALVRLLSYAGSLGQPVWVSNLSDVAHWWAEREQFALALTPLEGGRWDVAATCTPRATLLARHVVIEEQPTEPWTGPDVVVNARRFVVSSGVCPCLALSPETSAEVAAFLTEQGYPFQRVPQTDASAYALYIDEPPVQGATRTTDMLNRSALLDRIESLEAPLIRFACWPNRNRAALGITGDIDSVTIQDFFLRIAEAQKFTWARSAS